MSTRYFIVVVSVLMLPVPSLAAEQLTDLLNTGTVVVGSSTVVVLPAVELGEKGGGGGDGRSWHRFDHRNCLCTVRPLSAVRQLSYTRCIDHRSIEAKVGGSPTACVCWHINSVPICCCDDYRKQRKKQQNKQKTKAIASLLDYNI